MCSFNDGHATPSKNEPLVQSGFFVSNSPTRGIEANRVVTSCGGQDHCCALAIRSGPDNRMNTWYVPGVKNSFHDALLRTRRTISEL